MTMSHFDLLLALEEALHISSKTIVLAILVCFLLLVLFILFILFFIHQMWKDFDESNTNTITNQSGINKKR